MFSIEQHSSHRFYPYDILITCFRQLLFTDNLAQIHLDENHAIQIRKKRKTVVNLTAEVKTVL